MVFCRLLVYNGSCNTNDRWDIKMIETAYDELIQSLRRFTNNTNRLD